MWKPNEEGLNELLNLFSNSKSQDNKKQSEIYNKLNEYSNHSEFPNYLIYIMNSDNTVETRQVAGLTLKGIMERQFVSLTEDSLAYFRSNVLKSYLDENQAVRKTVSNLINTFIRHGGMESWPEILSFLLDNLDTNRGVEMSLQTMNIIIEDSGNYLEEKFGKFLSLLTSKLFMFLTTLNEINIHERNETLITLVLSTLYVLLESCPTIMTENIDQIVQVLLSLSTSQNFQTRYHLGRCWLCIIRLRKQILFSLIHNLFPFFIGNFSAEFYEMNFTSAEFFSICVEFFDEDEEEKGGSYSSESEGVILISRYLQENLEKLANYLLIHMKLTPNDISGMDSKYKEDNNAYKLGAGKSQPHSKSSSNSLNSQVSTKAHSNTSGPVSSNNVPSDENLNSQNNEKFDANQEDGDIDFDEDSEGYNPNFTLRKCCSKILDRLSHMYPAKLYEIIKPILENDIQSQDWLIKERSILGLGACAEGLYSLLKACLSITLLPFLVRELTHPHKLVRAIALWTLSRFTKFILVDNLSENSYSLFKEYLCETLKKFLDKEVIVQEAACTAFSTMVLTKKEKLEPYLFDIFKIVANVFNQYTGTSLLTLYDLVSLLTEYYPEHFKNVALIEEVVNCVVRRWFELIKTEDFKLVSPIFEMVGSIIKVSYEYTKQFFDFFLNGSLIIIENNYLQYVNNNKDSNYLDKESLSKSLDLISLLCNFYPTLVKETQNKHKILENFFKLIETDNSYLKHYLIAMIGDIAKADNTILKNKFDEILSVVFQNLDFPVSNNVEMEHLSVCNNACWTIGIMALNYPDQIRVNVTPILKKLLKIMSLPRLNKSLAQNISICIGRLAMIDPQNISNFLDSFLKQFCLSIRNIKDSEEKREAFTGLCKAILHNPNGVMNFFAFFCDAICHYDDAPEDLENLFQNIILSYKNTLREKWMDYFKMFPEKLKSKMSNRFKLK